MAKVASSPKRKRRHDASPLFGRTGLLRGWIRKNGCDCRRVFGLQVFPLARCRMEHSRNAILVAAVPDRFEMAGEKAEVQGATAEIRWGARDTKRLAVDRRVRVGSGPVVRAMGAATGPIAIPQLED